MRILSAALAAVAGLIAATADLKAQTWPTRPVTLIVPFTAGTTSDIVGRALGEQLAKSIGQPITIENRGGAGGNIGAAAVAKAAPDGYTLLLATTGQAATNQLMYKEIGYDPQRDFAPIVLIGKAPVIIAAKLDAPARTLPDLIAYAKANPDKLTAGFPGNGTLGHITGILLQQRAGVKLAAAQYRGTQQILTDLLGGHIDVAMDSMAAYVPNVQEGKLRALALASSKRWPNLPEVPTVAEAGLPGFEASVWYALLAPAGTPQEIVAKLNAATNEFLKSPATQEMFAKLGVETSGGTPEVLQAFMRSEVEKWAPIIKEAGITF